MNTSSLNLKVYRMWEDGNIKNILCIIEKDFNIKPGDFIKIGALSLPIFDISKVVGGVKLLTIYEDKLPNVEEIKIVRAKPTRGKILALGHIPNPIISILRQNGYEVFADTELRGKEYDLVIVSDPSYLNLLKGNEKILIAPALELSISKFNQFNSWLDEMGVKIYFNLNKPINLQKPTLFEANYFVRKIFVPKTFTSYSLKVFDGQIIVQQDKHNIILGAISFRKKVIVLSSISLIYPYDKIFGNGENTYFLIDLIKLDLGKLIKDVEKEKIVGEKSIETQPIHEIHALEIDIKNLSEADVFKAIANKLMKFGFIIKSRNDFNRRLSVLPEILGIQDTPIDIEVNNRKVFILASANMENRILRGFKMFIEEIIDEIYDKNVKYDKLRRAFKVLSEAHKKIITIKDMIELDINFGEIKSETFSLTNNLKSINEFSVVALNLEKYLEGLTLDNLKPIPEEKKIEFEEKLDELYEELDKIFEKMMLN